MRDAMTVASFVAAEPELRHKAVQVRGSLVLGGVCCQMCPCGAVLALSAGPRGDVAPHDGPLVLLHHAGGYADFEHEVGPFPSMCRFEWPSASYCCEDSALGREVVVTGIVMGWPGVHYSASIQAGTRRRFECNGIVTDRTLVSALCDFDVPWRRELDAVETLAVQSACRIDGT